MRGIITGFKAILIKFAKDSCLVRASGLAYSSLLAMIPFTTVIYAFGGFDTIGRIITGILVDSLIPTQQEAILKIINSFTRNSLATGTFGMIFFLLTTLFLINTVARNFDTIWGVEIQVGLFRRFTTYTAILVFGSLLLGLSTSLTDVIEGYLSSLFLTGNGEYSATVNMLVPFIITLFIFFLMLAIIPTVKIKFKSAAIGAFISAILFELVKFLFRLWAVTSVQISLIYGSLAIIPLFLVGLYLFWLIVLIGVEISFYIEHERNPAGGDPVNLNIEEQLTVGFDIYFSISSYFREKSGGITLLELKKDISIPDIMLDHFLKLFIDAGLVVAVSNKRGGLIPGRSLDKVWLKDISDVIYGCGNRIDSIDNKALFNAKSFTRGGYGGISNKSILDLVNDEKKSL